MKASRILAMFLLCTFGVPVYSWRYFTRFRDLKMTGSPKDELMKHSEYRFGDCKRSGIIYYTTVHLTNLEVSGKLIVRGWIKVYRIPTCIILRSFAFHDLLFRSTSFNFQMCVPRISYCHSKKMFKYYYYEWYIPTTYTGGMDWDLIFYGPPSLSWQ